MSSGSAAASIVVVEDGSDTAGKIPAAVFFEDVAAASAEHGAEALIAQLSELSQKYRL